MPPRQDRSWQAPSFSEDPAKRMSWVEEACIQEAESWMRGQAAYMDIPKALAIIAGTIDSKANNQRSDLVINHAKFLTRKIVAILADVRAGGQYTSDAKYYKARAGMMNKLTQAVALESQFPRKLRMALQYMSVTSCGYIWPRWTRINGGYGEARFEFVPLGLLDVLPVQMAADNSLQSAYSVTICEFMPVWMAHGKFPAFQETLQPIARRKYSSTVAARRMDLAERFKYGESSENWANLYCEIRRTFIRDLSINSTDMEIPMGEWELDEEKKPVRPSNSWSYMVPYVGQEIFAGMTPGGVRKTRKALPEDCMLYPQLRLITSSKGMKQPMYDGPAPDQHAMVPLARYCCDDWPWEPSGYSLLRDIFSSERARQTLERGMDQIAKARLDPALAFDRQAGLSDATAQTIDPFQTALRVGVDGDPSAVFAGILPDEFYNIPEWIPKDIEYLRNSEDAALGLNEMQNMEEFKASVQGGEDIEKALTLVGPLVKDISAGMEFSTVDIWNQLKFSIPQYMTAARVMQYVGPDGITPDTFDYDPDSLIPSHGPDEAKFENDNFVVPRTSGYTPMQRAKIFGQNLRLVTVPHTMHNITQTEEQLKYIQLYRTDFPIAPHDVAKKLNIENYGEIEGDTVFDRWKNWQNIKLELAAKAQALANSLMPQEPEPGNAAGGPPAPGGNTGPGGGQLGTGGRPPSAGAPPRLIQKNDASGPRSTITESK